MVMGCNVENEEAIGTTRLSVNTESRTSLGDTANGVRALLWAEGDKIEANGVVSDAVDSSSVGEPSAEFNFTTLLTPPYSVLSPASLYVDATTIALPAKREGAASEIDSPLYSYSNTSSINLQHLCGAIQLSIRGKEDLHQIIFAEFRSNGGEQVSGNFRIDYATGELTSLESGYASGRVRVYIREVPSLEKVIECYIVVPYGNYSKGYTIRIQDSSGHYMDFKREGEQTIKRGILHRIPEFEFIPTHTSFEIEI